MVNVGMVHHIIMYPRIVESLNGSEISMVAAGGNVSMALLADGSIYTWGNSECGSLGFSIDHGIASHTSGNGFVTTSSSSDPVLDGKNAVSLPCLMENVPSIATNVACSGSHTLIVAENGNGYNVYSQNNQHNYDSFASSTSYSYTSTNGHSSSAEAKITADHGEIITKYTKKERMENEPSNPQQMFDVKYIFSRTISKTAKSSLPMVTVYHLKSSTPKNV